MANKQQKNSTKKPVHPKTLANLEKRVPFQKGVDPRRNTEGRGATSRKMREELTGDLLESLKLYFHENKAALIADAAKNNPATLLKIISELLPKQVEDVTNPLEEATDDELDRIIQQSASEVAACTSTARERTKTTH